MSGLVDQLLGISGPLAYIVVGALVFAEAAVFVGFVLPGETAVVLGGVLASTGHMSLSVLLIVVVVVAVVGAASATRSVTTSAGECSRRGCCAGTRLGWNVPEGSCVSVVVGRSCWAGSPPSCQR